MKKLTTFLLSGVLLLGTVACSEAAKTSADAPNSTEKPAEAPKADNVQTTKEDGQSETRRKQLNADIKAREERNNVAGDPTKRASDDLESEVRSKLEANIPDGALTVEAEDDGTVTIAGTVLKQEQLAKIEPLAKKIKGVKTVNVKATVAAPKAQ
ncbi:MAG: BON domain-containing protein [Cyanobacteriota bacterium]|nr:BON domain-containing protein [Cyanobacteriota bacterium]